MAARCRELAARAWWVVAGLAVVITGLSFLVQPQLWVSFSARPWGICFSGGGGDSIALVRVWIATGNERGVFGFVGYRGDVGERGVWALSVCTSVERGFEFGLMIQCRGSQLTGRALALWVLVFALAIGQLRLHSPPLRRESSAQEGY